MSLRTAVGVILLTLAGLYLFVIPIFRVSQYPLERLYVPQFILLGLFGLLFVYAGWNDEPTKSP